MSGTFELTWKFRAQAGDQAARRYVEGMVRARSEVLAIAAVKRMGFARPKVSVDLMQSLGSGFGFVPPTDFDLRDKARLFETLGRALKRDAAIVPALEAAQEYLSDGRLKGAVAVVAASIGNGMTPAQAMAAAGFTHRDCMVAAAMTEAAALHRAFTDLAAEARSRHQRESAIRSAFRMPLIMLLVVYSLMIPGFYFVAGPYMLEFFAKLGGLKIPESVETVYSSIRWVQKNTELAVMFWVVTGAGFVAAKASGVWHLLIDRIGPIRALAERTDHAAVWSVYALMHQAGISPAEICSVIARATVNPKTANSLQAMARSIRAGAGDMEAVTSAGFPTFVVAGYRSARQSGSVSEGLASFTALLQEDIQQLSSQVQSWLQIASMFVMSMIVLGVFYLFYYPTAAAALANV